MKNFQMRWLIAALGTLLSMACSPQYDWREVRSGSAPFVVVLPAKPTTLSRPVNLGTILVTMEMVAAEAGGSTFAVGTAELPEGADAPAVLLMMKNALVGNIRGTIKVEKSVNVASSVNGAKVVAIEIEATGIRNGNNNGNAPVWLAARFVAQGKRVYQVLALGDPKAMTHDVTDIFFTSFKLN